MKQFKTITLLITLLVPFISFSQTAAEKDKEPLLSLLCLLSHRLWRVI